MPARREHRRAGPGPPTRRARPSCRGLAGSRRVGILSALHDGFSAKDGRRVGLDSLHDGPLSLSPPTCFWILANYNSDLEQSSTI